jgi:hypothetical protein
LRLVTGVPPGQVPPPPFGLTKWSTDGDAVAVLLHACREDTDDPAQVAAQIPHATELPPGTRVFVLGRAVRSGGMLRWLGMRTTPVRRAPRCTALVARGYISVGASVDADLAWGVA